MNAAAFLAAVAVAAYLVGAIPFGYLVARWRGVDILSQGSGNIGATNVGRILGRPFGVLVFLLDFAKGAVPVALARVFTPDDIAVEWAQVTAGIAAFLGHLFPVYLRFRGGKGVATGAGVVAVLVPAPTAGAMLAWLTVVSATRYVSLASLVAAAVLCSLRVGLAGEPWSGPAGVVTGFCFVAALLVAVRHRANIGRLLRGNENRLKESSTMTQLAKILHVLAIGLWFGSAVFFTATGLVVFGTFERIAELPATERPAWLPLPALYDLAPPSPRFPDPLRKEQGTRVAGAVVRPLFPLYFALQTACAAVALVTSLSWLRVAGSASRLRLVLVSAALACVVGGWFLERKVAELRGPRDDKTDELLRATSPGTEQIAAAETARRAFVQWHLASVLLNLITLALVTLATVLVAWLPSAALATKPSNEAVGNGTVMHAAADNPLPIRTG